MDKDEIIARLKDLVNDWDSDRVIDWGYDAFDALETIIKASNKTEE